MAVKHQTPITAHIEKCPECQKDLNVISSLGLTGSELVKAGDYLMENQATEAEFDQQTLATLNDIHNREMSNVLTRMRLEQAENTEQKWLSDSYTVEVQYRQVDPVLERRVFHRRPIPLWVKTGIAAAILFAVLLILPTQQDLGAIDLSQLYANLGTVQNIHIQMFGGSDSENVRNVHVRTFMQSESKEFQNIWIAEGLGIRLIQSEDSVVFWDLHAKQVFRKNQGGVELVSQGGEMELARPWGLLPFKNISELPTSYDWDYISDSTLEDGMQVKIYELTWKVKRSNDAVIERKWRGYLDIHSHLPYRIEWLDKIDDSPLYMTMMMQVSYPTDIECREVIENYGFQIVSYGDQNESLEIFPAASKSGLIDEGDLVSAWPSTNTALNF